MNARPFIWAGLFIGSTIGGFIPTIWDSGLLSMSSVIFSMFGGIIGMWIGYKLATY